MDDANPLLLDSALLARIRLPRVPEDGDKERRGRLLVIAGSRELAGAAVLAGTAGLRAGAGKLQIGTARSIAAALGVAMPEARVISYEEADDGGLAEEGIEALAGWAAKAQAVLTGCGMAGGASLERLMARLLGNGGAMPLVLDAAALGCLPAVEAELRAWPGGAILLPHAGEMARLLGLRREEVEADPGAAAALASERFNAIALVKGSRSFLASPDGRRFVHDGGGVGLATSGSGDVLAGLVAGLAARGAEPLAAALWGVWLHGEAGRQLARRVGRLGFLAREIAPLVPRLMDEQDSIHARRKGA